MNYLFFFIILFSSPYLFSTAQQKNFTFQSLTSFHAELKKLPEFYPNPMIPTQKTPLTFHECLTSLNFFMETTKNRVLKNQTWLNAQAPSSKVFALDNELFFPYLQRLIVKPGSEIALWGDLHGSAHSFVRTLIRLRSLGYLCDDFTISENHPDFYLVFLGDYVDRGSYCLEVLYLLLRLKIANPSRVIIIRGNHEHIPLNKNWNFIKEIHAKIGTKIRLDYFQNCFQAMPLALYLGSPDTNEKVNYVLCCHGGLEFGFDPLPLLTAPSNIHFQKLTSLKRKTYFETKFQTTKAVDKTSLESLKNKLLKMKGNYTIHHDYDELDQQNILKNIGFLWNDFANKKQGEQGDDNFVGWVRSWSFGKNITTLLFDWAESKNSSLRSVLRGHQHHDSMFSHLIKGHGVHSLWNGKVYTLFSSPAAGIIKHQQKLLRFTYDSFVIIKTAENYEDWSMTHWWRNYDAPNKTMKKWQKTVKKMQENS